MCDNRLLNKITLNCIEYEFLSSAAHLLMSSTAELKAEGVENSLRQHLHLRFGHGDMMIYDDTHHCSQDEWERGSYLISSYTRGTKNQLLVDGPVRDRKTKKNNLCSNWLDCELKIIRTMRLLTISFTMGSKNKQQHRRNMHQHFKELNLSSKA